jgi:SAM-dependent methyltransferase
MTGQNFDPQTVVGFGEEWARYDQSGLPPDEREKLFAEYFAVFPWAQLPDDAVGFDLGCGSGRWARLVAPRVGVLHCVDASAAALEVARRNLSDLSNCRFHQASVDGIPLPDGAADFGYSLGVLHHVPDTAAGIRSCVAKLKPGAPFLVYLYYAFDQRPLWFRALWRVSDAVRRLVCRMPMWVKVPVTTAVAATIYYPLARFARLVERCGRRVDGLPLAYYRNRSFYTMRTDALDRFGTRLEQRFTAAQIRAMMTAAGLEGITFSPSPPFWCAVGVKRNAGDTPLPRQDRPPGDGRSGDATNP